MEKMVIAVTATFTAEPLERPLAFWMEQLELAAGVEFAPYSQVFQQLLDPSSLLATNRNGVNVVLVRLEDWAGAKGYRRDGFPADALETIERNVHDLIDALETAAGRQASPYVVCVCPASPDALADGGYAALHGRMEELICGRLAGGSGLFPVRLSDFAGTYPVPDYDDPHGDRLGHIPYTQQYFTAMATVIARKIYRIRNAPHKVIVLDCDQTLWKGVCGEVGPMGIEIDAPRRALQEFALAQYKAGMLLCLCSKNEEEDVDRVFACRDDMPLRAEHVVARRINWGAKSENIRSLAAELQLGLDSFIFIDDDPVVCAEVQANCPEVLTLHLPADVSLIPKFLSHVWAFDHLKVTQEDEKRAQSYRDNAHRQRLLKDSLSFQDFIKSLGLVVEVSEIASEHVARVAQLTQRTNQFNTTTVRRTEGEVSRFGQPGAPRCLVAHVRDRFGDYGLVGCVVFRSAAESVCVESFMMSCRVLGRGVEHRMLSAVGDLARRDGAGSVEIRFVRSKKNQPALDFLNSLGVERERGEDGDLFRLSAEAAAALEFDPRRGAASAAAEAAGEPAQAAPAPEAAPAVAGLTVSALMNRIAAELCDVGHVCGLLEVKERQVAGARPPYVAPQGGIEKRLVEIWEDALGVRPIGLHDNFFELGGDSLAAVGVFSQIEEALGRDLSLAALFEAPTVEKLAALLSRADESASWPSLVAIQPRGTKPPLYCMHAAGANVMFYRDMSKYLGDDQPLYGLQPQGLGGRGERHRRVEDMAAHYIKEIREFQPEGPYHLCGSSFGGLLAYEMARQLSAQGQPVGLLALFDTYGPGYPKHLPGAGAFNKKFHRLVARCEHYVRDLITLSPRAKLDYVLQRAVKVRRRVRRGYRARKNDIARTFYAATGQDLPKELEKTQSAIREALANYVPPPYGGHMTLFRAGKQPRKIYPDPTLGWGPLVAGGLEIHEVPGNHGAVTVEPFAPFLVEKLRPCLERAQAEGRRSRPREALLAVPLGEQAPAAVHAG
jgi:FkbH-like protein